MASTRLRRSDDTGSLAMALLLTILALSLSAVLVPMVVTQVGSTRHVVQRVDALNAAQSGIDAALGQIRAATVDNVTGKLNLLPCGPLTGSLDPTNTGSTAGSWSVTIDYLLVKPPPGLTGTGPGTGLGDWLAAHPPIPCNNSTGAKVTPSYALLRATGTVPPAGTIGGSTRSLRATYVFQTTNANIPGGLIHLYQEPGGYDLCLDAGPSPAANTTLRVQQCDRNSTQQQFAYNSSLTLALVGSATTAPPGGLCLQADTPHSEGKLVRLQPCATPVTDAQRWSLNDVANIQGTTNGGPDSSCFNVPNPVPGTAVVLGWWYATDDPRNTCDSGRSDRRKNENFMPEASVGAGAAGPGNPPKPPPYQLVNFYEFGRCIDVPNGDPAYSYLIVWPCKQAPDPSTLSWNQLWTPPTAAGATSAPGRITVLYKDVTPNVLYCLVSPMSTDPGQYVRLAKCPASGTPPNMTWTVSGDTGSYPTSYRIMDGSGNNYCLAATDPTAVSPDFHNGGVQISKLVVVACSGSTLQKWNAPPETVHSGPVMDLNEPKASPGPSPGP